MIRVCNITLDIHDGVEKLKRKVSLATKTPISEFLTFAIVKRSLDARRAGRPRYVYAVDVTLADEGKRPMGKNVSAVKQYVYEAPKARRAPAHPPVVVGCGPAGLFAGLVLAEAGLCPVLLERGKDVDSRKADVERFWRHGIFDESSNVAFGEGGAGAFSDGKLTTGIKDPRVRYVLRTFADCGAPEEILWQAKPHVGTDRLTVVVKDLRRRIIGLGGEVRFGHQFIDFTCADNALRHITVINGDKTVEMETGRLVLAVGHSARDTVRMLYEKGLRMSAKPFAVGVRIEHPQGMIDEALYGEHAVALSPADYKLSARLPDGRGVYTFCMCPGGLVVAAATEKGGIVTNGMSYFARDLPNANAALLVSVSPEDFGSAHPLAGVAFQRKLEETAFALGGGGHRAPAQLVGDFLAGRGSTAFAGVTPTYAPGVTPSDIRLCFAEFPFISEGLKRGLLAFDERLPGFARADAVMTAVESRSSSPVAIWRGSDLQSSAVGVLPCGEGAGHAGGIMSAAVDGVRCAEAIINSYGS